MPSRVLKKVMLRWREGGRGTAMLMVDDDGDEGTGRGWRAPTVKDREDNQVLLYA